MDNMQIQWIGDLTMKKHFFDSAIEITIEATSEHDEMVKALVILGKTDQKLSGKIPFVYKDKLFLATYNDNFIVIVDECVLNIRHLIYMYDNDILKYSDLCLDLNLKYFFL